MKGLLATTDVNSIFFKKEKEEKKQLGNNSHDTSNIKLASLPFPLPFKQFLLCITSTFHLCREENRPNKTHHA